MAWVLLRKSVVADHIHNLPRPRIVQTVLRRGTRDECIDLLEEIATHPEHQGNDDIEVTLEVAKDRGQVDYNSKTIRKGNGQRNTSHLSGDASESDY
jgi:hypothetical protein